MRKLVRHFFYYVRMVGWVGSVLAVKGRLLGNTTLLTVKPSGAKHPFFLRVPSSDIAAYEQVFKKREYEFQAAQSPKIIVDAGANIGLASIFFANEFPNATIIAIEPEENNFALLKKNIESYGNIVPVQAALWEHDGELRLTDPGLGSWGFRTEEIAPGENQRVAIDAVPATTVCTLMDRFSIDKIDIFKIDIEGAEKEVFLNSARWIQRVDTIIIELHERSKSGCNRSFYNGTNGFGIEWTHGENVFVSRNSRPSAPCK